MRLLRLLKPRVTQFSKSRFHFCTPVLALHNFRLQIYPICTRISNWFSAPWRTGIHTAPTKVDDKFIEAHKRTKRRTIVNWILQNKSKVSQIIGLFSFSIWGVTHCAYWSHLVCALTKGTFFFLEFSTPLSSNHLKKASRM